MEAGFRHSVERGEDSVGYESARKQRDGIHGNGVFITREEFVGVCAAGAPALGRVSFAPLEFGR